MNENTIILLIILILFILLIPFRNDLENFVNSITDSNFRKIEKVMSKVDNIEYYVQGDYHNKDDAANMVSELNNTMLHFIKLLQQKYPNNARINRLAKRYDPEQLFEGNPISLMESGWL